MPKRSPNWLKVAVSHLTVHAAFQPPVSMSVKSEAMSNRNHYREHRIRTSLERHVGEGCDPSVVERLALDTYHADRGIYFTKEQLATMPWQSRELIESEGRGLRAAEKGG